MRLTNQARQTTPVDDKFPTLQLFILAICRVAEPIALTSIFPYSWVMVRDFGIGDESNASFYAGILISAFSLSESLTGMFWGGLSDRIGRKPVLLSGCFGTLISLLIVGLSPNFWVALVGRIVGGFLNGNIGVIQTMVGELVKNPDHEPRAYAVMPFVWSIGTIIGPAIGGTFASPAHTMPSVFSPDGIFAKFPFLLPNLICAGLLFLSIILGYFLLKETHPDMQPWIASAFRDNPATETPLMATAGSTAHPAADLRAESYGTFNDVDMHEDQEWNVNADGTSRPPSFSSVSESKKVFTKRVTMLIIALGIFTYHSMTYDHLLPIFLQDKAVKNIGDSPFDIPGGLGLETQTVGLIMSVNGIIALVIQAVVFPIFASWLGIWKLFVMVTVLHPIAYFIVPFLAFLPKNLLFPGIYTCLSIRNFLSILAYPVLLILIKQSSPSDSVLGKINGLAASAGAACRTIAPPIAGLLYGAGSKVGFTGVAWWGSCLVATFGAIQLWFMSGKRNTSVSVRAAAPCLAGAINHHNTSDEMSKDNVIHIVVEDPESEVETV
ncbi:hypothetical protein FQN54_002807 [Arachnomyces sp. PD_36]|nr:hypothetical protein FQN54_002807 [Arachnomyces sp. PD_36]